MNVREVMTRTPRTVGFPTPSRTPPASCARRTPAPCPWSRMGASSAW